MNSNFMEIVVQRTKILSDTYLIKTDNVIRENIEGFDLEQEFQRNDEKMNFEQKSEEYKFTKPMS